MMALHVASTRARAGPYPRLFRQGSDGEGRTSTRSGCGQIEPPILLVHGDQDEVIPLEALFLSAEALASADVPCQWHLSAGIGHGIDGEALRHGGLFLAHAFGLPYPK